MALKNSKLIVALDFDDIKKAEALIDKLKGVVKIFKVGSQLFTAYGPEAVRMVRRKGCEVFLDLKFHDIPNTVAGAAREAVKLGAFMFNVHTLGGLEMMREAKDATLVAANKFKKRKPILLGVTILTSLKDNDLKSCGINKPLKGEVIHLAKLAKRAGLDGVVASPLEIEAIRKSCGKNFVIVTPGIRTGVRKMGTHPLLKRGCVPILHDQKRIATPLDAIKKGANYIVVGRSITEASNPINSVLAIQTTIKEK